MGHNQLYQALISLTHNISTTPVRCALCVVRYVLRAMHYVIRAMRYALRVARQNHSCYNTPI